MVALISWRGKIFPAVIPVRGRKSLVSWLLIVLFLITSSVQAQFLSWLPYKGIDVAFGTRTFKIESDIDELDGLSVLEEGGQVGLIAGTDAVRLRAGVAGWFYSANRVGRTIDLFESDLSVNFYPSELDGGNSFVQPYLTGGLVYDRTKFYGRYLERDQGPINYSAGKEPFFGSMQQVRGSLGVGAEFSVHSGEFHFVHIFAECKYAGITVHDSSDDVLRDTRQINPMMISVGVRFGGRDGIME